MYRVIAILGSALTLAACSSAQIGGLDAFKPAPFMDTVSFDSEPAGADVKVSNGQTCKTPCALALPADQQLNVIFSLAGYESQSETLAPVVQTGQPTRLNPNPVTAELSPAAAKPPVKRKPRPAPRKPVAKKPAPAPKAASNPAPAPAAPAPAPTFAPAPASSSPWPAPPPPSR